MKIDYNNTIINFAGIKARKQFMEWMDNNISIIYIFIYYSSKHS